MGSTPGDDLYLDFSKLTRDEATALGPKSRLMISLKAAARMRAVRRVKFKLHGETRLSGYRMKSGASLP